MSNLFLSRSPKRLNRRFCKTLVSTKVVRLQYLLDALQACTVTAAICGTDAPAKANRVTAVPRKSWNVTPDIPAFLQAFSMTRGNPQTSMAGHGY